MGKWIQEKEEIVDVVECLDSCWCQRAVVVSLSLRGGKYAMAELTIQVSDTLAQRLQPFSDRLPALLAQLVISLESATTVASTLQSRAQLPETSVYTDVREFLLTRPTPQEIMSFKVSEAAQSRLRALLDKNREEGLTEAETGELDLYKQLDLVMALLKAKAFPVSKA
ncbi:MAG: hypothetical protein AB7G75_35980 [Candidatus Binatia bacterium]